jgi:hypothetical protein
MHSRDDARVPFDQGRQLAAGIAGARFVPLPSQNHLILEGEPAFPKFLQEIRLEHFSRRSAPIRQSRAPRQTKNGRVKIDVDDPSTSFTALRR